jgi:putative spermidine/putrescine transport system permease protein
VDSFTGSVIRQPTMDNFRSLLQESVYRRVALRSVGVASAVTVIDAAIALPMAFCMAKIASVRAQRLLVAAVLTPLWASYLVKIYAWRTMLSARGVADWALAPFGLSGPGYGLTATVIALAYLWLPFMILPVYAGFQRLPDSLLEASADLGASAWRTFRTVAMPIVFPALVAGSIFTFSLSLGDYIAVSIVGGRIQTIGTAVLQNITLDLPFAAALGTLSVAVMVLYLFAIRRFGGLDEL